MLQGTGKTVRGYFPFGASFLREDKRRESEGVCAYSVMTVNTILVENRNTEKKPILDRSRTPRRDKDGEERSESPWRAEDFDPSTVA